MAILLKSHEIAGHGETHLDSQEAETQASPETPASMNYRVKSHIKTQANQGAYV